jgi:RimJ/RimL family protein N-acetyltransferase
MIPLTSDRLILRDFTVDDFQAVHSYTSDPEVVRYMPWVLFTEEETHKYIQNKVARQSVSPRVDYELAITLKDDGILIGECNLIRRARADSEGDIGFVLNRNYWGMGLATEVTQILLTFGFKDLHLHRITATCDPQNVASSRVLEKNGMRLEGHFREHKLMRGKWRDSLFYAILDHEWSKLDKE